MVPGMDPGMKKRRNTLLLKEKLISIAMYTYSAARGVWGHAPQKNFEFWPF